MAWSENDNSLSRRRWLTAMGVASGLVAAGNGRGNDVAMAQSGVVTPLSSAAPPPLPQGISDEITELPRGATNNPRVLRAMTVPIRDVKVLVSEQGGLLMDLTVREGDQVEAGIEIARLDDRVLQKAKAVADTRVLAAEAEAKKDIQFRYAKSAADSAYADYISGFEANREAANSVSAFEIRQYELKYRESLFQMEQVRYELRVAGAKLDVSTAEAAAATVELELTRIRAPVTGIVIEKMRDRGEWLRPGEPIVRILQQDELYVQGWASAAHFSQQELLGRPVRVEIPLARGRTIPVDGSVTFADPTVQTGGIFEVRATIKNTKENGVWVLRPGVWTTMTLLVD